MKKKTKKGFTLAEMSVALAVIAIATAMLALCFVSISNFSEKKERQTEISREVSSFQKQLNASLQSYKTPEFYLVQNTSHAHEFQINTSTETFLFVYSLETQKLVLNTNSGEDIVFEFNHIEEVKFQTFESLIRCTTICDDKEFILVFNI